MRGSYKESKGGPTGWGREAGKTRPETPSFLAPFPRPPGILGTQRVSDLVTVVIFSCVFKFSFKKFFLSFEFIRVTL